VAQHQRRGVGERPWRTSKTAGSSPSATRSASSSWTVAGSPSWNQPTGTGRATATGWYVDPRGQERSRSFPDGKKRAAEAFLVEVESDKLRGSYVDPQAGRISFKDYADAWLADQS
jgi:hypothetical protein